MKKYIAPKMEISKFAAQDIVTVSGNDPVVSKITPATNESYTFNVSAAAEYDTF